MKWPSPSRLELAMAAFAFEVLSFGVSQGPMPCFNIKRKCHAIDR